MVKPMRVTQISILLLHRCGRLSAPVPSTSLTRMTSGRLTMRLRIMLRRFVTNFENDNSKHLLTTLQAWGIKNRASVFS